MAHTNTGTPVWIAPGATQTWWCGWGDNRGTQILTPDMKTPGAQLWATQQGKQLESNGSATYFVTIRNDGPNWCYYNLQGGGVC